MHVCMSSNNKNHIQLDIFTHNVHLPLYYSFALPSAADNHHTATTTVCTVNLLYIVINVWTDWIVVHSVCVCFFFFLFHIHCSNISLPYSVHLLCICCSMPMHNVQCVHTAVYQATHTHARYLLDSGEWAYIWAYVCVDGMLNSIRESFRSLKRAFFSACFCCECLWRRILWTECDLWVCTSIFATVEKETERKSEKRIHSYTWTGRREFISTVRHIKKLNT